MVPKGLERLASKGLCHDLRHAHGQSRGATGSVEDSVFAHVGCGLIDRFGGDHPTPIANYLGCLLRRVADYRRRTVHGEVDARIEHTCSGKRHYGDERLHQHAAVTDKTGVRLPLDHLWRRAGRDQRVKARHCAARDGDEKERE